MRKGLFFIVLAAFFWGLVPTFCRGLYAGGANVLDVAAMRCYVSAVVLVPLGFFQQRLPKMPLKHFLFFCAQGLLGFCLQYILYGMAVRQLSAAMAAMLLYTAPAFVILFSRVLYGQPITRAKLAALVLILAGNFLVVGGYDTANLKVNAVGILCGLACGLCYAIYTLMAQKGTAMYPSQVGTTVGFIGASVAFLFIRPVWNMLPASGGMMLAYVGVGLVGSALPALLFTRGIRQGVPSGTASLVVSLEPLFVALMAAVLFKEWMEWPQLVGMVLALGGVLLPGFADGKKAAAEGEGAVQMKKSPPGEEHGKG